MEGTTEALARLQRAEHIRWGRIGDRGVVLCLKTGHYYGLTPSTTDIWSALEDQVHRPEACARIASKYGVSLSTVEFDYDALVDDLQRRGWLTSGVPSGKLESATYGSSPPPAGWPRARAWLSLLAVSVRLRARGFSSAYAYASRRSRTAPAPVADQQELERALRAFATAENFFISRRGPDDCLSRSMSLFVFLRQLGFPARHRIGVADAPFMAHAWVDVGEEAVFEDPDRIRRFTVLASIN